MPGKYLSTPPASQSPGMAIQKNPYASDQVGGYNMFSGNYEATKQDLWSRLMDAMAKMGQGSPSKQEFDAYYDQLENQPAMGTGIAPGQPLAEQDWRMWEGAPTSARKEAEAGAAAKSEAAWQRMLKALKAETAKPEEPEMWNGMPLTRGK